MIFNRKHLNISLIILAILLGGTAAWLSGLPAHDLKVSDRSLEKGVVAAGDSLLSPSTVDALITSVAPSDETQHIQEGNNKDHDSSKNNQFYEIKSTGYEDADPQRMIANHPFRKEALKILNNHLEESDSINRRKILSYCERFRKSYTSKDINFIRQVFSDNALIIIGNVITTGKKADGQYDAKVSYAVRSKQAYISRLEEIFKANHKINVDFSDFKIMRHPSVKGLYGVSIHQKYKADRYSDDGYLFLLWDFRNPERPEIHVRTWQPHKIIAEGQEVIDISDFNIE